MWSPLQCQDASLGPHQIEFNLASCQFIQRGRVSFRHTSSSSTTSFLLLFLQALLWLLSQTVRCALFHRRVLWQFSLLSLYFYLINFIALPGQRLSKLACNLPRNVASLSVCCLTFCLSLCLVFDCPYPHAKLCLLLPVPIVVVSAPWQWLIVAIQQEDTVRDRARPRQDSTVQRTGDWAQKTEYWGQDQAMQVSIGSSPVHWQFFLQSGLSCSCSFYVCGGYNIECKSIYFAQLDVETKVDNW